MEGYLRSSSYGSLAAFSLVALASMTLWGCGGGDNHVADDSASGFAVAKATCGPNDKPETALQGQVTAAERAAGFEGTNCNLTLVGQSKNEGAAWSAAVFRDRAGRVCAYWGTELPSVNRQNPGVAVINMTSPASPFYVMSLTTPGMILPHESLRVHVGRQILIADRTAGPNLDIYDLSGGCDNPQVISTTLPGTGEPGSTVSPRPVMGHEGMISHDGLTYYMGNLPSSLYNAIDITSTTNPKLIATFDMRDTTLNPTLATLSHGLSISTDGNRAYATALNLPTIADVLDPMQIGRASCRERVSYHV